MAILSCVNNQLNIGVTSCSKLPQEIIGMITTPMNFSLSEEDAADPAKWQEAIQAAKGARIYMWPEAVTAENVSEEAVYEETTRSTMNVRDGKYRFRLSFSQNLEVHKAMFSHKGFRGRVYLLDSQYKLIGTNLLNGNFAGFSIDLLNVEKLMFNDGSVNSKTPVYISLKNNLELDRNGSMIDFSSIYSALVPLTSVNLSVTSPTATGGVVTVTSALDLVPILGLTLADFVYLDGSGAAQTLDSVVDNGDGTYTYTGTTLPDGTINLVAPSAMSINGFESAAPVTVTI